MHGGAFDRDHFFKEASRFLQLIQFMRGDILLEEAVFNGKRAVAFLLRRRNDSAIDEIPIAKIIVFRPRDFAVQNAFNNIIPLHAFRIIVGDVASRKASLPLRGKDQIVGKRRQRLQFAMRGFETLLRLLQKKAQGQIAAGQNDEQQEEDREKRPKLHDFGSRDRTVFLVRSP
ncbi:hypothetical protein V3H18_11850 [Methylocystis sp. 9N]|uniref:Uncharacterized protein n=1 Tax=Methylocystis borbori TaxID=3118750 RepID=A0ABU7XIM3_9HYPH